VVDVLVDQINVLSLKEKSVAAKLELKWSKTMAIAKFMKPKVVQIANANSGVMGKKAHLSQ
jgi:hypothetical protein